MEIGPFAGPIWTIILIVDCVFFLVLEWWMPREDMDFVCTEWDQERFRKVCKRFPRFHADETKPRFCFFLCSSPPMTEMQRESVLEVVVIFVEAVY